MQRRGSAGAEDRIRRMRRCPQLARRDSQKQAAVALRMAVGSSDCPVLEDGGPAIFSAGAKLSTLPGARSADGCRPSCVRLIGQRSNACFPFRVAWLLEQWILSETQSGSMPQANRESGGCSAVGLMRTCWACSLCYQVFAVGVSTPGQEHTACYDAEVGTAGGWLAQGLTTMFGERGG